ncbi:MAG: LUD domain-containing protein [Chloroflexia bacterium]|nr:LUD domain-containing protein [Chloroflexia bacterium]
MHTTDRATQPKTPAAGATDAALHDHPRDGHGAVHDPFRQRYATALANPRLSRNLTAFQRSWRDSRRDAVAEVDFAALRGRLKAVKTDVVANLDRYLDQFQAAAETAGVTVHRAPDAEAAVAIVRDLATAHGVRVIAKSKSMVSEEIDLNHALLPAGIDTVETDLGEWIVQLLGERPSHLVMPAIHLARQQVGAVFTEKLGRPVSADDVGEQVRVARDELREVFFTAGMGITGANALVAESGTVMMTTNEGNGRLCSSLPPVHVVLAGIEKLVPTFEDAMTQLRLLGRSATAQRLTSYSTFITGPTPGHAMHLVLLDNGRRRMASLPEYREALHCIRCAACANVCPPYREVGGHVFGHIYTGAIGLVVTPFHHGLDAAAGPQSLCLSCNACETVCPVGIPLPRQILDVRRMVVEAKGLPVAKRAGLALFARPRAFDLATRAGRLAGRPLTRRGGFVRSRRVPVLRRQTRWRSLPALAPVPLRDRERTRSTDERTSRPPVVPNGATGMSVALFPGCLTDRLYPEQGEAVAATLRALGVRVTLPLGLHCCGLPANNSGDVPHAVRMARQTIETLETTGTDTVVSGSASCVAMITQDYAHLFRDDLSWLARAEAVAARTIDFTSFLDRVARLPAGSLAAGPGEGPGEALAYHDSCQGLNALGLRAEPRRVLGEVLGIEVRGLAEGSLCCGFGGSFSFDYPEVAERLMNRKLDDAEATGATTLVTDNQGCIMHLRGGCDAAGRPLRVRHLAEVVAERLAVIESRGPAPENVV